MCGHFTVLANYTNYNSYSHLLTHRLADRSSREVASRARSICFLFLFFFLFSSLFVGRTSDASQPRHWVLDMFFFKLMQMVWTNSVTVHKMRSTRNEKSRTYTKRLLLFHVHGEHLKSERDRSSGVRSSFTLRKLLFCVVRLALLWEFVILFNRSHI